MVLTTTSSPALASQPLTCADLTVHAGGELQCSTFGGKSHVIELLGAGNSHACQEMDVDPRMPYELSGEVYPRSACGGDVPCPPSVVVCPGDYAGGLRHPSAVVVVRALPVLFPARYFCRGWPFKRTALCTLQAPFATSAVATSAASLRPRGQAHGRRSMRPLYRPSTRSPCASCSTAPAPLSSAISSSGSSSVRPQPPFTPSRLPSHIADAFAPLRMCSRITRTLPMPRISAYHVTKDGLGRQRIRAGVCGHASAARWRASARAHAGRSGCARLCVPRDAPR